MKYAKITLSAHELMSLSSNKTGIDIFDSTIEVPLTKLLFSLNHEAMLSEAGALGLKKRILRILCNRLRMQRDYLENPEINEIEITRPVFITSAPRTGSTKLHKLLAESGDFRYLLCWQGQGLSLRTGDRDEDPSDRIKDSEEENAFFNHHSPLAKLIHEYSTFQPEEDVLIYEHFLFAPYIGVFSYVPGYVRWYIEQRDMTSELIFLKQTLKYLQWQFYKVKSDRWLLKAPHYNGCEDSILSVFPDAKFIVTHRNPIQMASSLPSLYSNFLKAYSDVDRGKVVGPMVLDGLIQSIKKHLKVRENDPGIPFLDIRYSQLTTDITSVIRSVYDYLDISFSDVSLQRMLSWDKVNTQHRLGVHEHRLDDYALKTDIIRNQLEIYVKRFGCYF